MKPRHWRIIGVAGAALLLVVGWFVVIAPGRSATADLHVQAAAQAQQAQELRSRISLLKKQSEEVPAQQAVLAGVQARMPATASVPSLIRSLSAAAEDASVTMSGLTPEQPVTIQVAQEAPTAPSDDPVEGEVEDPADAEAAAGGQDDPAQAKVQRLPLTITVCGTFAQLRTYLSELEGLKRVMSVSRLAISRGSCTSGGPDSDLTATVGASVFILPAEAAGAASATAATAVTNGAS
ncbi:MAG: type II secretion system protein M [Candidatus Nanopelagicales bacterium]|jgi:Tfp pilus assembly protein PilO|nr:type II secretion system protein M [Candidatus Nanopelagicales bacterium]